MANGFTCQRRVEFRDTDAAGIAHFSVFFVWMEQAEHEALRHVGMSVMERETEITWPRVSATCDYQAPVFFEEELQIAVRIAKLGSKSVTYGFAFRCGNRDIATGQLTTVCCQLGANHSLTAMPIPEPLAKKLRRLT
jgi:4-hydroxybenzoyl-CoA thioesterase/acyl-CoA thioester hydrolase